MKFNSYIFILLFLPITLICYFLLGKKSSKLSNVFLLLVSLFFYGYSSVNDLLIIVLYVAINYLLYLQVIKKNRIIYIINIIVDVLFLFIFKYTGFLLENINAIFATGYSSKLIAPMAISFYTFSQISLVVDAYKNETKYSFIDYALYTLYFPKIVQGPITNAKYLIEQFNNENKKFVNYDNISEGFIRFILGLSKKVLLADVLSRAANWGFSNIDSLNCLEAIIVVLSFTFQLYFDFSGYSDMAYGISKMFNIDLIENFDFPYTANNISEFWKKWHVSLTNFLTRYVYIPLGGNRRGELRTILNTLIVFTISGLWHGANWNYVLWGFLNGVLLVIYKANKNHIYKLGKYLNWLITFVVVNVLWIVFRTNSLADFYLMLAKIFSFKSFSLGSKLISCFEIKAFDFVPESMYFIRMFKSSRYYVFAYLLISFALSIFGKKIRDKFIDNKSIVISVVVIALLILSILSLTDVSVFLYEGF